MQSAITVVICILVLPVFSQSKSNPIITMLNYKLVPVQNAKGFSYIESMWKEDSVWHVQLFSFPEKQLYADFFYKDSLRKERTGVYQQFNSNGLLSDSGNYVKNEKNGDFFSWFDDGSQKSIFHYKNGMPSDTCITWTHDGQLFKYSITNEWGSGIGVHFYPSGKAKGRGKIFDGKNHGKWHFFREDGTALMDVDFIKDSVVNALCFDTLGQVKKGECIYERSISFPGGNQAFNQFLAQYMKYPDEAQIKGISGTVKIKFQVDTDGTLSNFSIVSSPSQILSNEVLRLMQKSPNWQPAIQLNQPVKQYHIQRIGFYLE